VKNKVKLNIATSEAITCGNKDEEKSDWTLLQI
jgi:hypothetical protein